MYSFLGANSSVLEKIPFHKSLGVQESKQKAEVVTLVKNVRISTKCTTVLLLGCGIAGIPRKFASERKNIMPLRPQYRTFK